MATTENRRLGEAPVVVVPEHPSFAQRANGWRYAAQTTNPPASTGSTIGL